MVDVSCCVCIIVRFQEEKKRKKKGKHKDASGIAGVPAPSVARPPDTEPEAAAIARRASMVGNPDSAAAHIMLSTEQQLATLMKETEELRRAPRSGKMKVMGVGNEDGDASWATRREHGDLDAEFGGSGSGDGTGGSLRHIEDTASRKNLRMGPDGKWTHVAVVSRKDSDLPAEDEEDIEERAPRERGLVAVSKGTDAAGPGAARLARMKPTFGTSGGGYDSFARSEEPDDSALSRAAPVPSASVQANPSTLKYLHGMVMGTGTNLFIKQKAGREAGGTRTVWGPS